MKKICKQCGKSFELTQSEIDFYKNKGLELPKRCKKCRDINRKSLGKKSNDSIRVNHYSNNNSDDKFIGIKAIKKTAYICVVLIILYFVCGNLNLDWLSFNNDTISTDSSQNVSVTTSYQTEEDYSLDFTQQTTITSASSNIDSVITSTTQAEISTIDTTTITTVTTTDITTTRNTYKNYTFRNNKLFASHYQKHGAEMNCNSPEEYLQKANDVINNPNALHKLEAEDNDDVYYLESTQELVIVSTDGYIRTYFSASLDYFNRQ